MGSRRLHVVTSAEDGFVLAAYSEQEMRELANWASTTDPARVPDGHSLHNVEGTDRRIIIPDPDWLSASDRAAVIKDVEEVVGQIRRALQS